MLLDAASLYYRAYFGVPENVTAPDGTPVNAVRGFLDMTAHLITTRRPTGVVACLDEDWRPAFRVAAIPSYKAHRLAPDSTEAEATPDTLAPQVPILMAVLDAAGIVRVGAAGYEADDIIGTLATRADGPVDIVTGDRDLLQLIRDAGPVRVCYTGRGVTNLELFDEAAVAAKYAIPGRAYADYAVLRGDPSDGLPGVPGVGDKTAATLITAYGSLDALLADLDGTPPTTALRAVTPAVRKKLHGARDYLAAAPAVVRVCTDIPLPVLTAAVPTQPADPEVLLELADRWGLGGSVERLLRACAG
ncbi:5'-3' exonuclease [soil metagenome]